MGEFRTDPNTPAVLGVNQNNYDPGSTALARIAASTPVNITGLLPTGGNNDGRRLMLVNVGANTITLTNEDVASTAANRIITGTGLSLALVADGVAILAYDTTTARWRVVGGSAYSSTSGAFNWSVNTPANIAADQNNYDTGDAVIIRLNPTGTDRLITGLAPTGGNTDGRIMLLQNISTTLDVTLKDQDAGSSAANRFLTGVGDITLSPNDAVFVWYDATSLRWRAALGI